MLLKGHKIQCCRRRECWRSTYSNLTTVSNTVSDMWNVLRVGLKCAHHKRKNRNDVKGWTRQLAWLWWLTHNIYVDQIITLYTSNIYNFHLSLYLKKLEKNQQKQATENEEKQKEVEAMRTRTDTQMAGGPALPWPPPPHACYTHTLHSMATRSLLLLRTKRGNLTWLFWYSSPTCSSSASPAPSAITST